MSERHGACLCGKVRYKVTGALRPVIFCHCMQCRKQTGHFMAATAAADQDLAIEGTRYLNWYRSSANARRAFCSYCGSLLFWKAEDRKVTSIMAGSMNGPTGLTASAHIFCAEKGDYYQIADDVAQYPGFD